MIFTFHTCRRGSGWILVNRLLWFRNALSRHYFRWIYLTAAATFICLTVPSLRIFGKLRPSEVKILLSHSGASQGGSIKAICRRLLNRASKYHLLTSLIRSTIRRFLKIEGGLIRGA